MLNTVYRLVAPRKFEIEFSDMDLNSDSVIVRPTHLSICNADQRYYQGKRAPEILAKKLPMALIHEGIGKVVRDVSGEYMPGEYVVMIPNTPTEEDSVIAENYLRSSRFRASGFDGFMQDNVVMARDRVVRLPEWVNKDVAAFTEIISVGYHAVDRFIRFSHERRDHVAVWGDGNLAFIVALILRYRLPESKIYVMGKNHDKLEMFSFADKVFHISDIPVDIKIDHAFECVGGEGSPKAIDQIIDYIAPEATIGLLGVSENPVPVNTRMILEKGLRMFGSSRSGRKDFENTVAFFEKHPETVGYLANIVGQIIEVRKIEDAHTAFKLDMQKTFGKTVMHWDI